MSGGHSNDPTSQYQFSLLVNILKTMTKHLTNLEEKKYLFWVAL